MDDIDYEWSAIATSREWTPDLYHLFTGLAAWSTATTGDEDVDDATKDRALEDACRLLQRVDYERALENCRKDPNLMERAVWAATSCFLAKACECNTKQERIAFMETTSPVIREHWHTFNINFID